MSLIEFYKLQNYDERFFYMFLDRLRSDCLYYLGKGGRLKKHLWALDERKQIELMKEVHEILSTKPLWCSKLEIAKLETEMCKQC